MENILNAREQAWIDQYSKMSKEELAAEIGKDEQQEYIHQLRIFNTKLFLLLTQKTLE